VNRRRNDRGNGRGDVSPCIRAVMMPSRTCDRRLLKRITSFSINRTPKNPQPMMKSGNGYVMCFGASKASSRISRTCQSTWKNTIVFIVHSRRLSNTFYGSFKLTFFIFDKAVTLTGVVITHELCEYATV